MQIILIILLYSIGYLMGYVNHVPDDCVEQKQIPVETVAKKTFI